MSTPGHPPCPLTVVDQQATLLVVPDGQNGFEAADVTTRAVLDRLGGQPPPGLAARDLVDHPISHAELVVRLRCPDEPRRRFPSTVLRCSGMWRKGMMT